jgi:hypothetical protein
MQEEIKMNAGLLYQGFGLHEQTYQGISYGDGGTVIKIRTKDAKLRSPCCKDKEAIRANPPAG